MLKYCSQSWLLFPNPVPLIPASLSPVRNTPAKHAKKIARTMKRMESLLSKTPLEKSQARDGK